MNTALAKQHPFISRLENLVREKDRGALATLRRGLGKPPGTAREMDRYVLPFLPHDAGEKQENAYYLIGALFAYWHQGKDTIVTEVPVNLGDSLRRLVNHEAAETGNWEDAKKRMEKRFIALLNCHRDDLPNHLRHVISLLKSKEISVNWTQLLWDAQGWQQESHDIQREWARKFWRGFQKADQTGLDEHQSHNDENTEEE